MQIIVLAIAGLLLAFDEPVFPWVSNARTVIALALASILIPFPVAVLFCRKALKALDRRADDPGHGQAIYARGLTLSQTLLGISQTALLALTSWQTLVHQIPRIGNWPVVPELIALCPFLVSVLLIWIAFYGADRAIRQIALEFYLVRGKPVRPVWRLRDYLAFNLRHQVLFILAPLFLIVVARDVIELYRRDLHRLLPNQFLPDLLLGAATILVAVIAPVLLRHIWVTRRLPDGPLRDRLAAICKKLRLRCREILVWRTGGMLVNAAVMGVIPPFRYVLISDGMLEQMDDRKIEAVFGHEAGHVKRHHILFFLLFALISGCLMTIVSVRTQHIEHTFHQQARFAALGGVLLFKWGVLFGWVSRRFERQADVYGVRTLAMMGLPCAAPCAVHGLSPSPSPGQVRGAGLSPSSSQGEGRGEGPTFQSDSEFLEHDLLEPNSINSSVGDVRAAGQDIDDSDAESGSVAPKIQDPESKIQNERPTRSPIDSADALFAFHSADRGVLASIQSSRPSPYTAPLCATAAHLFGDTLHQVAVLNGIPPEAKSWRHGSIASRSRVLQYLAMNPAASIRFERRVLYVKISIFICAAVAASWAAYDLNLWRLFRSFF